MPKKKARPAQHQKRQPGRERKAFRAPVVELAEDEAWHHKVFTRAREQ